MVRKSMLGLVVVAMMASLFVGIPLAQANTPIRVLINGAALTMDVAPVIQSGRTLVPMRAIFEAMGAQVHWDDATSTIRAYRRESAIVLQLGNRKAWVNGPAVQLDVAPVAISGRTLVPLRFVAEALGAEVGWEDATRTVTVKHTPYVAKPVGGTITYGQTADPVMLNPILGTDTASSAVYGRTNWGLTRGNQKTEPSNALADRWDWDPQTLTWRFWLNPNAKWHDGVPVTAKDVKFTFDTVMHADYDGARKSSVSQVAEIVEIDKHTVDFKMKKVDAPFLFNIGLGLLPHHVLGNVPVKEHRAHAYSRDPKVFLGNGPYILDRWVSGQYVELKRNPNFFQGPRPYLERVVFKNYPDLNVMQTAFENGDIDWYGALQTDHIERIMKQHADRAYFKELPNHGYDYMSFNLVHPILSDLKVREALVVGLDRVAMVTTILDKRGVVIHAHQIPTTWATGATGLNHYSHSAVRARQLLTEAGWVVPAGSKDGVRMKDGQRLTLKVIWNSGNTIRGDVASMAVSYWKRIGVEASEEVLEWSVVLSRFSSGQYDLLIIGWALGLDPDPYPMFHSSQAAKDAAGLIGGFNRGQYKNPEVDKLLEAARETIDIAERRAYYQQIDQILNRELPYLWLFQRTTVTAIANRIQGITWAPTGNIWVETMFIKP